MTRTFFYGKKFKISTFYFKNLFICVKVWFYENILKTKSLIVCSIIFIFDKLIRDDANWRKRQFNTVNLFFHSFVWTQSTKYLPHAVRTMYRVAMYRIKYPLPNGPMPVPIGKFGRNPLQKTCLRSLYPKCEASVWYPPGKKGHYTPLKS